MNRLQKLSLCVSYNTLLRLLDKIGADYDQKVKNWSYSLMSTIPDLKPGVSYMFQHNNIYIYGGLSMVDHKQ